MKTIESPPRPGRRGTETRPGTGSPRTAAPGDRLRTPHRAWASSWIRFDSGHALALRAIGDGGPAGAVALLLRSPDGAVSAWTDPTEDRRRLESLLPAHRAAVGPIRLSWNGGRLLTVRAPERRLTWSLRLRSSRLTRLLNRRLPAVDRGTYHHLRNLAPVRAVADAALGHARSTARSLHLVGESRAVVDGVELGPPRPAPGIRRALGSSVPGVLVEGRVELT